MPLAWKILTSADSGWHCLSDLEGATLFHCAAYSRVVERGFGGPVLVAALLDEGGRVVAGWPALSWTVGPVRQLYGVFPKGNFVGPADVVRAHLPALRETCRAAGIHLVRMVSCDEDPIRELRGARRIRHLWHVMDLTGKTPESLWSGYKQIVRRQVRQARKAGLSVRPMRRDEFPAFHEMYGEMMQRNRAAVAPSPATYEALWDAFHDDGRAEFLVAARPDGVPVAAIIGVHDPPVTCYYAGCSRTDSLHLHPNDLMMHALIESAVCRGHTRMDFSSTYAGQEGLIRFKEKWGAERRTHNLLEWWFSAWRRCLWDAGMKVARNRLGAVLVRWGLGGSRKR
jgi:hypothetical protein